MRLPSITFIFITAPLSTRGFTIAPRRSCGQFTIESRSISRPGSSPSRVSLASDDDSMTDEQVLKEASKSQFIELCEQFGLPTDGSKEVLLQRLRDYAEEQAEKDRQIRMERKRRVEEGSDDEREKFEIVGGSEDEVDEEDEGVFYFYQDVPESEKSNEKKHTAKNSKQLTQSDITAPPPPSIEPDENGERVVTVYSTTDQNDLTGVAAAQPGQAILGDPMTSNLVEPENAPWDTNNPQKAEASSADLDASKAAVSDLVQSLLAMSGAPAFQQDADDLAFLGSVRQTSSYTAPNGFVGFDPTKVPTDMLIKASKDLRAGRGTVLKDVLREYELRAVGQDGAFGDDMKKGGGHYRQVSKVRSFLEGFRRAEVRRLARETATMLLDKLVSEGIEGLDITLASMTRSGDDTSDEAGELNDSLLDYLNDIIRQQERKVEQLVDSVKKITELENAVASPSEDDMEKLWTIDNEDGQRVESFDPSLPENRKALQEEMKRAEIDYIPQEIIPTTAAEKSLLLLKLLRERVKTEAAFSHDEKSRNLRILAYSLRLKTDEQRQELLLKEFGASLDRLDSFTELVSSSIEYGESTSHQLQPTKQGSLNVNLLKRILKVSQDVKKRQSWKATGVQGKTNFKA